MLARDDGRAMLSGYRAAWLCHLEVVAAEPCTRRALSPGWRGLEL